MGPAMAQSSIKITLPEEGIPLNIFVFRNYVFPLNALIFASKFIVVHPYVITSD
jgi:hypothetical protein